MKKRVTVLLLTVVSAVTMISLAGCGHEHTWSKATCTDPKTCKECGETKGEPLGHEWIKANCTDPKTCEVCGETKGEALGHEWLSATCTSPMICKNCGETQGDPLGHTWTEGDCVTPRTCSVCKETDGSVSEHHLDSKGKCTVCGQQVGFALNSSNYTNYLSVKFDSYKDEEGRYIITCTTEPLKNVIFCDVVVTLGYTGVNYKFSEMNAYAERSAYVNSDGYANGSFLTDSNQTYGTRPTKIKFASITGYVIE